MEDKGIYEVVEIPDTPDRLSARHVSHGNFRGKEQVVSVAGHLSFTKEGRPQQPMNGSGLGSENDRSGRRCTHLPSRTLIDLDEFNHISDDASENLHSPQNSRVFKRTIPGRNSKNEERLNVSTEYLDKGKKLCYEVPQKSSCAKDIGLSDFSLPNRHSQMIETAFASGASNNIADDKKKGREVAREASSRAPDSIMTSSCAYKGKEKVVEYSGKGYGAAKDHVKQVDQINNSHGKLVKEISMPTTSAISVGTNGRKRLVRNGCISPHNIAIRGRQIAECNRTNPENGNINGTSNEIGHSAQCPVDITDIIADNKDGTRVSGRGTDFHLSTVNGGRAAHHPSNVRDRDGIPWSCAKEETGAASDASKYALQYLGENSGWRSTKNHLKRNSNTVSDADIYISRSNTASGCIMDSRNMEQTITGNDISSVECAISRNHTAQRDSLLLSDSNQISMPSHDASFLGKRQKKYGATNKNRGQSSTSVPKDSEIVCTDSYRVSRNSRPSGLRSSRTQHPVIEVDDLSPVIRHSHSQSAWSVDNDNTIARASQIEADEMLARELQEQLYYEDPVGSAGEVDEHIAWALQLEERATNTASRERQVLQYPRAPSHRQPRLQPQSHPFCNTSHRSGSQPRAPSSSRMAQLRNRFRRQSPALPRGEHLLEFPFDMDLDMRIDILEALEAADGDLDMGLDNHLLQFQQNFNVNDYETLLALDENSHHAGASGSQINSLPLSTVQTENFETCAICLEAPSIGETVRHLPCLHKFHKDCIDPWLSRKTSCPVCKSSIT